MVGAAGPPPCETSAPAGSAPDAPVVVALNDAGVLFNALAEKIVGAAADWSPTALDLLEERLEERYGLQLGGPEAIKRLVEVATRPVAA